MPTSNQSQTGQRPTIHWPGGTGGGTEYVYYVRSTVLCTEYCTMYVYVEGEQSMKVLVDVRVRTSQDHRN